MELKSSKGKLIVKSNLRIKSDDDGHNYIIHEEDSELFNNLLNRCIENNYDEDSLGDFEALFGNNMTGGCPDAFIEENIPNSIISEDLIKYWESEISNYSGLWDSFPEDRCPERQEWERMDELATHFYYLSRTLLDELKKLR